MVQSNSSAIELTRLHAGDFAVLDDSDLGRQELDLLHALGMTPRCRFRVCKAGDPWIVQVLATRIGLADAVARRLRVVPEPRS